MKKWGMVALTLMTVIAGNLCDKTISVSSRTMPSIGRKQFTSEDEFVRSIYDNIVLDEEPEDNIDVSQGLRATSIIVNVKTMCDAQYRKAHSSDWEIRAKRTVKEATTYLYDFIGIKFVVKEGVAFTSASTTNPEKLLDDFISHYKVGNGIDMIVGLSGRKPKDTAGIAYKGKIEGGPRVLIFPSTYKSEVETVQHEIGHTYNLEHCNKACVMKASGFGYLNKVCGVHGDWWCFRREWY